MFPDFPEIKAYLSPFLDGHFRRRVRVKMGLFGESPHVVIPEGSHTRLHRHDQTIDDTKMSSIEGKCIFNVKPERGLSPEDSFKNIEEMAQQMADQQVREIIDLFSNVTNETGNVVHAEAGITAKTLNDMLDKMDIPFDSKGNAILPSMIGHPDTMKKLMEQKDIIESDVQEKIRQQEILEKKKEDFRVKQSNRRLVG